MDEDRGNGRLIHTWLTGGDVVELREGFDSIKTFKVLLADLFQKKIHSGINTAALTF